MDIFNIALRFLLAAAAGFAVMSFFGIRALVAVCSSVPLARRRQKEFPAFDLVLAFRRILRQTVLGVLGVSVITVLVSGFMAVFFPLEEKEAEHGKSHH